LLHEHWNSDLRLFSYDENGAYNLLQVCIHSLLFCFRGFANLAVCSDLVGIQIYQKH
jgi:hypothetical protein